MRKPRRNMINAMKDRNPSRKAVMAHLNAFRPLGTQEITLTKKRRGKLPDDAIDDVGSE